MHLPGATSEAPNPHSLSDKSSSCQMLCPFTPVLEGSLHTQEGWPCPDSCKVTSYPKRQKEAPRWQNLGPSCPGPRTGLSCSSWALSTPGYSMIYEAAVPAIEWALVAVGTRHLSHSLEPVSGSTSLWDEKSLITGAQLLHRGIEAVLALLKYCLICSFARNFARFIFKPHLIEVKKKK